MKLKKVLITGGAGFIGSNLSRALLEKNVEVDIVDDMSNGHREFVPAGCNLIIEDFVSDLV